MAPAPLYAGIGSRQTPDSVLKLMQDTAELAASHRWILRTGGAPGADQAFIFGAPQRCEVYLPWATFEKAVLDPLSIKRVMPEPAAKALEDVALYHPAPEKLSQGAKRLHARNQHIILGPRLEKPVNAVISWTTAGAMVGGTAVAMRVAQKYDVPILNLGSEGAPSDAQSLLKWLSAQL